MLPHLALKDHVIRVFHDEKIWSQHLLFDSKLGIPGALCVESVLILLFLPFDDGPMGRKSLCQVIFLTTVLKRAVEPYSPK